MMPAQSFASVPMTHNTPLALGESVGPAFMSPTIGKLAEALSKAQAEIKNAAKDKNNPFFESTYADLASVWDACREPLTKNGLSVTQPLSVDANGKPILNTLLLHVSGEWILSQVPVIAVKQDPQAYGSAITYFRRFSLSTIVGVAPAEKPTQDDVSDDDDDGNSASGRAMPPSDPRRDPLNREMMALYKPFTTRFPSVNVAEVLKTRYGARETKLLTVEQLNDFITWVKAELAQPSQPLIAYAPPAEKTPSPEQIKRLYAMASAARLEHAEVKSHIFDRYKRESSKNLSLQEYQELCSYIEAKIPIAK